MPEPEPTVRSEFQVHLLNDEGISKAAELSVVFSQALTKIEHLVPRTPETGRLLALVTTKLQEASFFAKRAIAVDVTNQRT